MAKSKNQSKLIGVDKRGGVGYHAIDCSRGISPDCAGTVYVSKAVGETVCAYCVIALTGAKVRDKAQKTPGIQGAFEGIRKKGIRQVARLLGVNHSVVSKWLKSKSIPEKYVKELPLIGI